MNADLDLAELRERATSNGGAPAHEVLTLIGRLEVAETENARLQRWADACEGQMRREAQELGVAMSEGAALRQQNDGLYLAVQMAGKEQDALRRQVEDLTAEKERLEGQWCEEMAKFGNAVGEAIALRQRAEKAEAQVERGDKVVAEVLKVHGTNKSMYGCPLCGAIAEWEANR